MEEHPLLVSSWRTNRLTGILVVDELRASAAPTNRREMIIRIVNLACLLWIQPEQHRTAAVTYSKPSL